MFKTSVLFGCVMLLAATAVGCVAIRAGALPATDHVRLVDGGIDAAPPEGVVRFCANHPGYCGSALNLRGLQPVDTATGAAGFAPSASQTPEQMFQLLLRTRAESHVRATDVVRPIDVTLDQRMWRQLWSINASVNWELLPARDEDIYAQDEVWALPLTERTPGQPPRGDCEDYVLEKRARLLSAGWPPNSLSIATAIAPGEGLHAVLVAHTDRGDIVLDNLHESPRPIGQVPYTWLTQQTGRDILSWSRARVQASRLN